MIKKCEIGREYGCPYLGTCGEDTKDVCSISSSILNPKSIEYLYTQVYEGSVIWANKEGRIMSCIPSEKTKGRKLIDKLREKTEKEVKERLKKLNVTDLAKELE